MALDSMTPTYCSLDLRKFRRALALIMAGAFIIGFIFAVLLSASHFADRIEAKRQLAAEYHDTTAEMQERIAALQQEKSELESENTRLLEVVSLLDQDNRALRETLLKAAQVGVEVNFPSPAYALDSLVERRGNSLANGLALLTIPLNGKLMILPGRQHLVG